MVIRNGALKKHLKINGTQLKVTNMQNKAFSTEADIETIDNKM